LYLIHLHTFNKFENKKSCNMNVIVSSFIIMLLALFYGSSYVPYDSILVLVVV